MEMYERLRRAADYLIASKAVESQVDIARKMGANEKTISFALNGKNGYVTEKLMKRFCRTFTQIDVEWLLYGTGDMLVKEPELPSFVANDNSGQIAHGGSHIINNTHNTTRPGSTEEHDRLIKLEAEREVIRKIVEGMDDPGTALEVLRKVLGV